MKETKIYRDSETFTKDYFRILSPEFPEFLHDYINTPEMQRIGKTSTSCGAYYTKLYDLRFNYSNLEHSIGVALIVWNFTRDKKATIAGLFHDIATPCFKHCIDFMHGDSETQESTEELTEAFIRDSKEIMALLNRDNIKVEEIYDYQIYPIADNKAPRLSADRLEYTLASGVFYPEIFDIADVKKYYDDLVVCPNENGVPELTFKTKEIATDFVVKARNIWERFFESKDKLLMQFFADVLSRMSEQGFISESDLYKYSEQEILAKIKNCQDPKIRSAFGKFINATESFESDIEIKNKYCRKIKTKKRFINPLVKTENGVARISDISETANDVITKWKNFECPDWAYFDFDF